MHTKEAYIGYLESKGVKVIKMFPPHGGTIEFDNDINGHGVNMFQKWLPHDIEDSTHPAKVGDMVTVAAHLAICAGATVFEVSAVRTFKYNKRSFGTRQVELVGLPCRWFAINHFVEYQGLQITSHIWGDMFNYVPDEKEIIIVDRKGQHHKGRQMRAPIYPNR